MSKLVPVVFACFILPGWADPLSAQDALAPIPLIEGKVPPQGIRLPKEKGEALEAKLGQLSSSFQRVGSHKLASDAAIYLKAVRFALRHGEWYAAKDTEKADEALAEAEKRIKLLEKGETPWAEARGLVVRGFFSKIDQSPQPYGLEVPEGLDQSKPVPLYVWLHGRGDKTTDLHFIHDRTRRPGQFRQDDGIVLHPFGRQCLGYKAAGEVDVLEAIDHVSSQYKIDEDRIVLMGFSMGGAGAWHLGAHFTDRFCAVHPGAGFAETAQYNRLKPEAYPPEYEQRLWRLYDVPNYARNFLNVPLIAYSGENDKQKQAADVMAAALAEHGHRLKHVIGPGMGHKYHPDSVEEITAFLRGAVEKGRNPYPDKVSLQTRTLRYNRMHWITLHGREEHWREARIDAAADEEARSVTVTTKNATHFEVMLPWSVGKLTIDGRGADIPGENSGTVRLKLEGNRWVHDLRNALNPKKSGLQGPIDDAFLSEFLVVRPSKKSGNPLLDRWIEFEIQHFEKRWRELFRGYPPIKFDTQVKMEDLEKKNLILWGSPETNSVWPMVNKMFKAEGTRSLQDGMNVTVLTLKHLPAVEGTELTETGRNATVNELAKGLAAIENWDEKIRGSGEDTIELNLFDLKEKQVEATVQFIHEQFKTKKLKFVHTKEIKSDPATSVVAMIHPSPFTANRYVVFNSGPTFREAHDRTNSLQNPKLPDWAVIDLTQEPNASSPGRITAAGFFDEQWEFSGHRTWVHAD